MRLAWLATAALVLGCAKPDPAPAPAPPAAATPAAGPAAVFEPAPLANRKLRPPETPAIINIPAGMGKSGGTPTRPSS